MESDGECYIEPVVGTIIASTQLSLSFSAPPSPPRSHLYTSIGAERSDRTPVGA
jgi:hypothetical protein